MPALLLLALLHALIFSNLVGHDTAAGADCAPDQRAFSAAQQSAGNCAACCRTANDLGAGVVLAIMRSLGLLGALVTLRLSLRMRCMRGALREARDGKRK